MNILAAEPFERSTSVGSLSELQHSAVIFSRWSLALRLTPEEGEHTLDMATESLAEDYPELSDGDIRHAVRKAHALGEAGDQGTLTKLSSFIAKTRAGGLVLTTFTPTPPGSQA